MIFTHKAILGIVVISLLGSVTLAYGLSTEFLFEITIAGGTPFATITNSTHILVTDLSSQTIQIFDLSGSSTPPSITTSNFPRGITMNDTHILVTDNIGIEVFDLDGTNRGSIASGPLLTPLGLTMNKTNIVVADEGNDEIIVLDLSGNQVSTFGSGIVSLPRDVAIDTNGRIIVADSGQNQITIFDSLGNLLTKFGNSTLSAPRGVAVDSNDRIIVSDSGNDRVVVFDSSGNVLTIFGSTGAVDGEFNTPQMLAVDSSNRIIVPDSSNGDVQVFAYATESSTGGGSSANRHKTAPTSGLDWNTHNPLVKDGVSVDGKSFDITDNWWTPFEQIQIGTNSMHTFTAKTFAQNGGLMVQEFAFGIPQIGEYQNAEAMIEVHYNYDKSIRDVVVVQDTEVIMVSSINATTAQVSCDDGLAMCYQTSVSMVFNEPLKDKVYAIHAWDMSRRSMMPHYFNDGINIVGEMINPLPIKTIPGTIKGEGLITITQVEKYSDLWIAEDGRVFEMYGESDSIRLTNVETKRVTDTGHVNSRTHSAWDMLIEHQNEMAAKYFDSSKIQNPDRGFIAPTLDDNGIDQRTETLQKLNWR